MPDARGGNILYPKDWENHWEKMETLHYTANFFPDY